jgi:hypothetical protein
MIILRCILKRQDGGDKGWIHLAQIRDQWWALVTMIMNFRFHKMLENSRTGVQLVASSEGLGSVKLFSSLVPIMCGS